MEEKLLIGTVTKPQGIKGEIKVKTYCDSAFSLSNVKNVYIDGKEYKVLNIRPNKEDLFMSLRGIADRNEAETLRNKNLFALREDIVKEEDSFFVVDILGCVVVTDTDKIIGKIVDITTGKVDVYYCENNGKRASFPFIKQLEPKIDIQNKKITVNGEKLKEVILYEN